MMRFPWNPVGNGAGVLGGSFGGSAVAIEIVLVTETAKGKNSSGV